MSSSVWGSPWTLPLRMLSFLGWFTGQFVVTTFRVLAFIMTPGRAAEPAIVGFAIDELSDTEVTLLIALITITPDTLVIAVDRRAGQMFVHSVFAARDPEGFRASLRDTHDRLIGGLRARPVVASHERSGA